MGPKADVIFAASQGSRTDVVALLEYSKTHTDALCWAEFPGLMARSYRAVTARRAACVGAQRVRPNVTVYFGPTGVGKSHRCMMEASGGANGIFGETEFYSMVTPSSDKCVPWIDRYMGEENVVIEDFDGTIQFRILLRMLDQYQNMMQVKGGMVHFCPKHIWISSNKHPRDWYPTEAYEGGPLERRLEKDATGKIVELTTVWSEAVLAALME